MSNILTYPLIPIVAGDDMMVISDVSVKGNPTRSVSVDQLGAYIGAGGGGAAGVTSLNAKVGAITLVGGTNITLGTVGNTITINSGAGGGTVTSLTTGVGGDALLATVTNPTTTPNIAFGWQGNSTQYINGLGALRLLNTIPTNITLAVTRTTGDATLTGNVLDIPNYGGGGGGGTVTSLTTTGTTGVATLAAGVLNVPNYANTTNFSLASDTGTTSAMAAGNTLTIEGGTGIETVVSGNPGGARSVLNLSDTTVTAGSYTFSALNIDAQGRITGASSGSPVPYRTLVFDIIRTATNVYSREIWYNDTGVNWTLARGGIGDYTMTAPTGTGGLLGGNRVHFSVMNANRVAPSSGTGVLPQPTVARIKTADVFAVEVFDNQTGTVVGNSADVPVSAGNYKISIEVRIYNVSV
jgi:hypothetical protein